MGRGNSKAEFLGFRGRRQAAATDRDISLPEVRSTEIIRAGDLTRVAAGERLVLCVAAFASAQPLCRVPRTTVIVVWLLSVLGRPVAVLLGGLSGAQNQSAGSAVALD